MLDHEKNKQLLHALGIEKAMAMKKIAGSDAVYAGAIIHEWQLEVIDEGLKNNDKTEHIAERTGVSVRTVLRRKEAYLHRKS